MKFKTVLKAHAPLALCAAACTMAMLGVLRALGVWGPQVVWGAVLGTGASMANLLLLQMTVQCAEQAADPAAAEPLIRRAAVLRLLILCAVGYAGLMLPGLFAPAAVRAAAAQCGPAVGLCPAKVFLPGGAEGLNFCGKSRSDQKSPAIHQDRRALIVWLCRRGLRTGCPG